MPARKKAVTFPADLVPKACSAPELGHSRPVRRGCWVTQWWGSPLVASISIPAALFHCGAGGSAGRHRTCPAHRMGWNLKGSDCCSGDVAVWHWHVLSQPRADPNWLSPTCTGNGNCGNQEAAPQEKRTRPCRPRKFPELIPGYHTAEMILEEERVAEWQRSQQLLGPKASVTQDCSGTSRTWAASMTTTLVVSGQAVSTTTGLTPATQPRSGSAPMLPGSPAPTSGQRPSGLGRDATSSGIRMVVAPVPAQSAAAET
ncbi:uncharacterized protein PRD47_001606 isoform 2-T2 [Ara ararauna]